MTNIKTKIFLVSTLVLASVVFFGYQKAEAATNTTGYDFQGTCDMDGTNGDCFYNRTLPDNDEYQAYKGGWAGFYDGTGSGGHIRVRGCLSNGWAWMSSGDACWTLYDWIRGNSDGQMGPKTDALPSTGNLTDDYNYWNVNVYLNDAVTQNDLSVWGRRVSTDISAPNNVNVGDNFTISWDIDEHGGTSQDPNPDVTNMSGSISCGSSTNADGSVSCTATSPGIVKVRAEGKGYGGFGAVTSEWSAEETINIDGPSDVTVTCRITDGSTGLRLNNANCSIASQSGNTNSNGEWTTPNSFSTGTRTLTVTKSGYDSYSGSYNITSSTTLPVTLWPSGGGGGSGVNCSPNSQSTTIGQTVNFSAGGGSGSYSWALTSGSGTASPPTSSTNSFTTSFNQAGTKVITVTRGSSSDTCSVTVNGNGGGGCTPNALLEFVTPFPTTFAPGQVYNFDVRLTNIGEIRYTHGTWWRLDEQNTTVPTANMVTNDGTPGQEENYFNTGAYIPGQSSILNFTMTAPGLGSYQLGYQMSHKWSIVSYGTDNIPPCPSGNGPDYFFGNNLTSSFTVANPVPTADLKVRRPSEALGLATDGPLAIAYNTNAILSWTSANATACQLFINGTTPSWTGTQHQETAPPWVDTLNLTSTMSYRLDCTGAGGATSDFVTIYVNQPPTVDNVTISSATIRADNTTPYNITVYSSDLTGGANITHNYVLINYQGSNAGNYRGYLSWYFDTAYTGWDGLKDKRTCTNGGIAAIQAGYGETFLRLDSCSTSVSGNTRTTTFTVRFDPTFTTPVTDNDISGYTANNITGLTDGWDNFDINFSLLYNNAQYISQTVPTTLAPGQTTSVSITMRNNGTTTWTFDELHRLGEYYLLVPQGNWGVGRAYLNVGESVAPNTNKTFTFNITAPITQGNYNFRWMMVEEWDGVFGEWFGEITPNVVITVAAPPNPPSGLTLDNTVNCGKINLSWNDNSSNEDGFRIYRGTVSGSLSLIASANPNATTFEDTPPSTGVVYYYQVSAYTASPATESARSNEASAMNVTCQANLSNSTKRVAFVNGVPYTTQTVENGDMLTFRIRLINQGNANAPINSISDTLSNYLDAPGSCANGGSGTWCFRIDKNGNGLYNTDAGESGSITGTDPNLTINVSGTLPTGGSPWIILFDVLVAASGSSTFNTLSNTAIVNYTDPTGSHNITLPTGNILFMNNPSKIPKFKEVAP